MTDVQVDIHFPVFVQGGFFTIDESINGIFSAENFDSLDVSYIKSYEIILFSDAFIGSGKTLIERGMLYIKYYLTIPENISRRSLHIMFERIRMQKNQLSFIKYNYAISWKEQWTFDSDLKFYLKYNLKSKYVLLDPILKYFKPELFEEGVSMNKYTKTILRRNNRFFGLQHFYTEKDNRKSHKFVWNHGITFESRKDVRYPEGTKPPFIFDQKIEDVPTVLQIKDYILAPWNLSDFNNDGEKNSSFLSDNDSTDGNYKSIIENYKSIIEKYEMDTKKRDEDDIIWAGNYKSIIEKHKLDIEKYKEDYNQQAEIYKLVIEKYKEDYIEVVEKYNKMAEIINQLSKKSKPIIIT